MSRRDWLAAGALWAATSLVFGLGAGNRGFYADDAGMLISLPFADLRRLWAGMLGYVPGRNLHILWQYLLFRAAGDPLANLPALHLLQAALDGLATAAFFLVLRRLRLPADAAFIAAALFSFWPNHGETHFWLSSAPMNLLSTIFVLAFVVTSVRLAAGPSRPAWLWLLDAAVFFAALFTYDQVLFALLLVAAARMVAGFRALTPQLPHLAATVFYGWLKWTTGLEGGPGLRWDALVTLRGNFADSISWTVGLLFRRRLGTLWANTTPADWLLALLLAAGLAAVALWLRRDDAGGDRAGSPRLFLLALLFWIAAYLPVWLWFISSRHHYLPSVGLFAGGAVCLAWLLDRLRWPAWRAVLLALLCAGAGSFVAAGRGESRYWEESFLLKKRLFTELRPVLENKEILVLEDFPSSFGPAVGLTAQDAQYAPRLLFHGLPLHPSFNGDTSGVAAPGGIFLYTLPQLHGLAGFRYYPTASILYARFTERRAGRLEYQTLAVQPPYQVLSSEATPGDGGFQVRQVTARRDGADVRVSLRLQAHLAPATWLAALASAEHGGGFHYWGRANRDGSQKIIPLLLSDPGPDPRPGGFERRLLLRLPSFPATNRMRLEFFAAARDAAPVRLGEVEAAVEP